MAHSLVEPGIKVIGSVLVFCLVFGLSATVDVNCIKGQLQNRTAILTGLLLQFLLMPLLGFVMVKTFDFEKEIGIPLLILTSSPGGSFSNWWCSIFNADLALSVTMTGISTFLSIIMLPINLYVYANLTYEDDVVRMIEWGSLAFVLLIVICGIAAGLFASYHHPTHEFHMNANRLGNFAGVALVIFSAIMSNSDAEHQLWERDYKFYIGVAAPCVIGLVVSNIITSSLWLLKPERVTVSIECCYQNIGIATTVAMTMFSDDDAMLASAVSVPFFYGCVEAILLGTYCLGAWKAGWTKAPIDASLWNVMTTSYEVMAHKDHTYPSGGSGGKCSGSPNKCLQDAFAEKGENTNDDSYCYIEQGDAPPQVELANKENMEKDSTNGYAAMS